MAARPDNDQPWVHFDQQDRIATIVLACPPVNALSDRMLADLDSALDLAERHAPSVVIVRSAVKVFIAGADLRSIGPRLGTHEGARAMEQTVRQMHRIFDRLARLPAVTVAEIRGAAVGGGLEFALACDLRVVADDATLSLPEVGLGLLPGAGGTQRLTRLCGAGTAARLILAGDQIKGREAVHLGLAQWSGAADEIEDITARISERIAGFPSSAISHAKACIALAAVPGSVGAEAEISSIVQLMTQADTKRRIDDFLAKSVKSALSNDTNAL